jgi:peptidyl-prolyl cis-trans isomerase SurA
MKIKRWGLAAGVALFFSGQAFAVVVDRVVAVVNKEIITQSELDESAKSRAQEQKISREELLNRMIEKKLELQSARRKGIYVKDDELKVALEDIKQRNGFESDEALKRAVSNEGVSWESYLANLRDELTLFKLIGREVDANLLVTDEELKRYYETNKDAFLLPPRVRLRQIFLSAPSNASPEQVERVQKRVQEIEVLLKNEGKDFARLAEEHGEGPERRAGGEIGFFHRGELAPAIEQVVFELSEGEVSGVIRSPAGFHLLKVEERKAEDPKPFDQVRKQVEAEVVAKKREELRQKWVSELWTESYVEIK